AQDRSDRHVRLHEDRAGVGRVLLFREAVSELDRAVSERVRLMSSRRKLLLFPIAGLVAALLWTTLGSFTSASGQTNKTIIARAHAGEFAPSYTRPIFILMLGGDARSGNP